MLIMHLYLQWNLILFLIFHFSVEISLAHMANHANNEIVVSEVAIIEKNIPFFQQDVEAHFPGGTDALMKFIKDNLSYPPEAVAEKITGKVYLGFIVEKNGSLSNVEVLRGVHPLLDAEAIRLIQSMPNWIPGTLNNEPARTRLRIPISFVL